MSAVDLGGLVWDASFERGDQAELADGVIERLRRIFGHLVSYGGTLYGHHRGVFEPLNEDAVARLIKSLAGAPIMGGPDGTKVIGVIRVSSSLVRGVVQLMHVELAAPEFFDSAAAGVAFTDGFVTITAEGPRLTQHDAAHRARHRYAFPYASAAEPRAFLDFLSQVFRDDPDQQQKIAAIQEFAGAAITGLAPQYERALMLFGPGANGKTRLATILEATMPVGSVVAIPPSLWADQYQRPRLNGARLNVVPDLTDDELGPAAKGIISGEGVAARDPGRAAVTFKPKAAHLFGCNKLPSTKDTSPGFWRRWLIVPMTRSFLGDPERDPHVVERIVPSELPGITRWALEGAARLMQRREYTLPTSHHVALARWRGVEDGPRLFLESYTRPIVPGERGELSATLLEAFTSWGRPFGVAMTASAFGRALVSMGVPAKHSAQGERYSVRLREGT